MTAEYTATVTEHATADPLVGHLLDGRYQIRSRIARGGMATVYLATDLRLERRVAVKVMHGHLADDAAFRERFIREARSAARLAHPNVVAVFDQGEDDRMAYLVMEYLPGMTLRELLQEHRVLTTEQTFDIMEAVLSGLAAAHKAGIVHRDLKPENVMLADDGRIKIGDFGLARAVSANTATGAALLGTIAYLSPELVTRGTADARSDIYAIGIMLYEMLTGEQPYKGEQPVQIAYQHANSSVPAPSRRNPRVPAELDELVLWATARDPENRPADARMLLDQLFETHSALMTALPGTGSDTGARTAIFPGIGRQPTGETMAYGMMPGDTGETMVLGGRGSSRATEPTAAVSLSTQTLQVRAARRRRRGWVWLLLVVLLALGGAFAGWWFGFGPGGRIAVPPVAGMTQQAASDAITGVGLTVLDPEYDHSPTVPEGDVIRTDPGEGEMVLKTDGVHLVISQGPQMYDLPAGVVGMSFGDAVTALGSHWVVNDDITQARRVYDAAAPGTVLDFFAGDKSLKGQTQLADQTPITLEVSVGPIPDVLGQASAAAIQKLKDAGLVVGDPTQAYSDDVPADGVISVTPRSAAPVPYGDTVDVVVSQGPQPIPVPDESGKTVTQAIKDLKAAGFNVNVPGIDPMFYSFYVVDKTSPAAGATAHKGDTITISAHYSFGL